MTGTLDRGWLDSRRVERGLRAFETGPPLYVAHRVGRVWRWITLELWAQDFLD